MPQAPEFLLAKTLQRLDEAAALKGWWVSEKYDGLRAYWDGERLVWPVLHCSGPLPPAPTPHPILRWVWAEGSAWCGGWGPFLKGPGRPTGAAEWRGRRGPKGGFGSGCRRLESGWEAISVGYKAVAGPLKGARSG